MRFVAGAEAEPYRGHGLSSVWPEYLQYDAVGDRNWRRLYAELADFQFLLLEGDEVIAEGNCAPVAGQPVHWRDALTAAFEPRGAPDRLCALAIIISPSRQGDGLSRVMLEYMRGLASQFGLLVAPVRPNRKDCYPLIPIEEYLAWRRPDGSHVDPWIRTHERAGGRIAGAAEDAMVIEGSVAEWSEWTGLEFPGDGDYVVPGALAPVRFDGGRGVYREPCVWLRHEVTQPDPVVDR